MKYILLLFLLFCNILKSQDIQFNDSITDKPIEGVLVYCNETYVGLSNSNGKLILKDKCNQVNIFKDGYEEKLVNLSATSKQIKLTPIRTYLIEEVVLKKVNTNDVLTKVKDNLKSSFYVGVMPQKSGVYQYHIINNLKHNNKDLIFYNDIFRFISNDGYYINNGFNNYIKNYKIIERNNGNHLNMQKYFLYDDKFVFWKSFTCINNSLLTDETLISLLNNYKQHNVKSFVDKDKIKITFSNTDFFSYLIVDANNYGINEYFYKKSNFKETSPKYFNNKKQSYNISYEDKHYINFNVENKIYLKSFSSKSKFSHGVNQFESKYYFVPTQIENIAHNLKRIKICDLDYLDK